MTDLLATVFVDNAPDVAAWGGTPECVTADPEAFFPDKGHPPDVAALCLRCPVAGPCLDYALSLPGSEDFGVWGGTTPRQRIRIRRERGLQTGRRQEGRL